MTDALISLVQHLAAHQTYAERCSHSFSLLLLMQQWVNNESDNESDIESDNETDLQ